MKFERLLQIYWTKGFLYGGDIVPFETPLKKLFNEFEGLSYANFFEVSKKLELSVILKKNPLCSNISEDTNRVINLYLAQTSSVNIPLSDLIQMVSVRYYLTKAYRGRCLALGKPARGQRTWSNAHTSSQILNHVRTYIAKFKKTHIKVEEVKKINYKILQRKTLKPAPKFLKKVVKKPATIWL